MEYIYIEYIYRIYIYIHIYIYTYISNYVDIGFNMVYLCSTTAIQLHRISGGCLMISGS